jgi:hypothetical protein
MKRAIRVIVAVVLGVTLTGVVSAASCDKTCLENIASQYRAAYRLHDPSLAPFARKPRYVENNVEMQFPDGTWDTVTLEVGEPLVLSDPVTSQVGIYTTVLQRDTQTFLAIRLRVAGGRITEIEHVVSTRRNLSAPPTPIGDIWRNPRDPDFTREVPVAQRADRSRLQVLANGYFSTLQNNNGEIRGARFTPDATRNENGMLFPHIEAGFRSGRYHFNNRVRDRNCLLVDEVRSAVMCRGYIDHKGVLDEYQLTDGTKVKSVYAEPQSWSFLESFKVRGDQITAVEATFTGAPYYIHSPFEKSPDAVYDALQP